MSIIRTAGRFFVMCKEMMLNPSRIWFWSCTAHRKGFVTFARILKFLNWFIFRAILPYEAHLDIESHPDLAHYGLGVVVHPNVKIGKRVKIFHQVTLASETWIGSPFSITIEDDVVIGVGAKVIGRGNQDLVIGRGAVVGANAVVTKNVASGDVVAGIPAKSIKQSVKTSV